MTCVEEWLDDAKAKLALAIIHSLSVDDWQAVYEDALIGRTVFAKRTMQPVSRSTVSTSC